MAEEQSAERKKKNTNTKMPSALKRDIQSEQRRLRNRSYRSSLNTAVRNFETALTKKEKLETVKEKLNVVYSLMDKGVKKGIYKLNKAARTKSRLTTRIKIA